MGYPKILEDENIIVISSQDLKACMENLNIENQEDKEYDDRFEIRKKNGKLTLIYNYHNPRYYKDVKTNASDLENKIPQLLDFLKDCRIEKFLPVPVFHCPQSHGIVIASKNGNFLI